MTEKKHRLEKKGPPKRQAFFIDIVAKTHPRSLGRHKHHFAFVGLFFARYFYQIVAIGNR